MAHAGRAASAIRGTASWPVRRGGLRDGGRERRQSASLAARCGREEAVVADAMKAVRQGVQQEAPDELIGRKRDDLRLA